MGLAAEGSILAVEWFPCSTADSATDLSVDNSTGIGSFHA